MSGGKTTATKLRSWLRRMKEPGFIQGEHPLPAVLEEEGGLEAYRRRVERLPDTHPGKAGSLGTLDEIDSLFGRKEKPASGGEGLG